MLQTNDATDAGWCDFSTLAEGDVEPTLKKTIHTLISKSPTYIVYLDEDLYVEWACSCSSSESLAAGWADVLNRISMLEAVPVDCLTREQVLSFRRMVGEGVARLYDVRTSTASATAALDLAEAWVTARNREVSRRWYLTASGTAAGMVGLVAVLLWLFRFSAHDRISREAFQIVFGGMLGGVGALLSVIWRSTELNLDPAAGKKLHYMEGAARVVAGGLGAMLIALAYKANICTRIRGHHHTLVPVVGGVLHDCRSKRAPRAELC